jgi:hypothetical protein
MPGLADVGRFAMRKKLGLFVLTIALLVLTGIVVSPFFLRQDVTKNTCNLLKAGMTRDEVRAVFGGRPYDTSDNEERWIGYEGCARLIYDDNGHLVWREWDNMPRRNRFPESIGWPVRWPID